ncbi:MAG: hypothetical protein NT041_01695 [Candidatus Vogelbacteria bacterium]|nr:hypothetical protein [Candidatus Vogelbacteria bacterium]
MKEESVRHNLMEGVLPMCKALLCLACPGRLDVNPGISLLRDGEVGDQPKLQKVMACGTCCHLHWADTGAMVQKPDGKGGIVGAYFDPVASLVVKRPDKIDPEFGVTD